MFKKIPYIYNINPAVAQAIEFSANSHHLLPIVLTLLQQHISEHVLTKSAIDIEHLYTLGSIEERLTKGDPKILSFLERELEALNKKKDWSRVAAESTRVVHSIANSIIRLANEETIEASA